MNFDFAQIILVNFSSIIFIFERIVEQGISRTPWPGKPWSESTCKRIPAATTEAAIVTRASSSIGSSTKVFHYFRQNMNRKRSSDAFYVFFTSYSHPIQTLSWFKNFVKQDTALPVPKMVRTTSSTTALSRVYRPDPSALLTKVII